MKERATVVKVTGKIASVRIVKNPQCESCKACAFKNGKSTVKIKAKNEIGAKVGDEVVVSCERDNRTLASFLVYIVPVLFAGIGALIGYFSFKKEIFIVLLCLGTMAAGFALVVVFDRILSKTKGFGMEVVEIINTDKQEEQQNDT